MSNFHSVLEEMPLFIRIMVWIELKRDKEMLGKYGSMVKDTIIARRVLNFKEGPWLVCGGDIPKLIERRNSDKIN